VSGVPEAEDDDEALKAVEHFRMEVLRRQTKTAKHIIPTSSYLFQQT
jgi:hypothetical protein